MIKVLGSRIFNGPLSWAGVALFAILISMTIIMPISMPGTVSADMPSSGESASLSEKDRVEAGRVVYQQNCASCHGFKAEGAPNWKRPNALAEMPAPPHNSSGHSWRHTDADLSKMISEGLRDPFNKTKQLTMPPFNKALSPEEINSVISYFKTLWTPEQRQFQQQENQRPPPIR